MLTIETSGAERHELLPPGCQVQHILPRGDYGLHQGAGTLMSLYYSSSNSPYENVSFDRARTRPCCWSSRIRTLALEDSCQVRSCCRISAYLWRKTRLGWMNSFIHYRSQWRLSSLVILCIEHFAGQFPPALGGAKPRPLLLPPPTLPRGAGRPSRRRRAWLHPAPPGGQGGQGGAGGRSA